MRILRHGKHMRHQPVGQPVNQPAPDYANQQIQQKTGSQRLVAFGGFAAGVKLGNVFKRACGEVDIDDGEVANDRGDEDEQAVMLCTQRVHYIRRGENDDENGQSPGQHVGQPVAQGFKFHDARP